VFHLFLLANGIVGEFKHLPIIHRAAVADVQNLLCVATQVDW